MALAISKASPSLSSSVAPWELPFRELHPKAHCFHLHRVLLSFLGCAVPVQLLCSKQGHRWLGQVAVSPIQLDLECHQGWALPPPWAVCSSATTRLGDMPSSCGAWGCPPLLGRFKPITPVLTQEALLSSLCPAVLQPPPKATEGSSWSLLLWVPQSFAAWCQLLPVPWHPLDLAAAAFASFPFWHLWQGPAQQRQAVVPISSVPRWWLCHAAWGPRLPPCRHQSLEEFQSRGLGPFVALLC